MSIVLVGGHDRMHSEYMGICPHKVPTKGFYMVLVELIITNGGEKDV